MSRPAAPALEFGILASRAPAISTKPEPLFPGQTLVSLPVRRYSCTRMSPRKSVNVDATTITGAKLVGAHLLGELPDRVIVVEIGTIDGEAKA